MTQTYGDPFADDSTDHADDAGIFGTPGGQDDDEIFATGTPKPGGYPRMVELIGKLLILDPVRRDKSLFEGREQDRWRAHAVVQAADGTWKEHREMFWSQTVMVAALDQAADARRPLLGVMRLVPHKTISEKFPTSAALLADPVVGEWVREGGYGLPPRRVVWVLEKPSTDQLKAAAEWWRANRRGR